MKKILLSLTMMLCAFAANAADLYVVGSMNGWTCADAAYKMTETKAGSEWTYTFSVDLVNKEFKINDGTWNFDLGSSSRLDADNTITLTSGGANIKIAAKYKKAENVTITLKKEGDSYKLSAKGGFSTTGEVVVPDLYLRSAAASENWDAIDMYKFTKNATDWTLTATVTDPMAEGFKIATADWGGYNFGNTGTSIEADEPYALYNDGGSSNIIMGESIITGKPYLFTLKNAGEDWTLTITPAEESGINNIATSTSKSLYNIAGQKVTTAKGLVIINGKKVIIK